MQKFQMPSLDSPELDLPCTQLIYKSSHLKHWLLVIQITHLPKKQVSLIGKTIEMHEPHGFAVLVTSTFGANPDRNLHL